MSNGKILVTGGLGYIGSHTIVDLIEHGYEVVSLDNELNASAEVLKGIAAITGVTVENIHVDLVNTSVATTEVRAHGPFDGIIHFAALKSVEESVFHPVRYFQNNLGCVLSTLALLDELNIPHLIFSSSCTVYGAPQRLPVTEDTPMAKAESPYGASKQASEIMYEQYFSSLRKRGDESKSGISLRYFNPAGAHPSALIGESPVNKATNLVPVITETAVGIRKSLMIYGADYETRDGSCLRDYIHVMDLARAHRLALEYLIAGKNDERYEIFNLGSGTGITVKEAVDTFENTTQMKLDYQYGPRRAGDVAAIYADASLISDKLGWRPQYMLSDIMRTAWEWEKARRK